MPNKGTSAMGPGMIGTVAVLAGLGLVAVAVDAGRVVGVAQARRGREEREQSERADDGDRAGAERDLQAHRVRIAAGAHCRWLWRTAEGGASQRQEGTGSREMRK